MESLSKTSLFTPTIIQPIDSIANNSIFVKRDDLLPFSFGGNKARKAQYFFNEILQGDYDTVVTYGSSSSNHCRVVANMACKYGLACFIVSPEEEYQYTFNTVLVKEFGAKIVKAPLNKISQTIDTLMKDLSVNTKPYFIAGGGHGNLGTKAYHDAYNEICDWENENGIYFDYIFHASGTGTTQAGLVCGAALKDDNKRQIVGISIARQNPRGKDVVTESVNDYLKSIGFKGKIPKINFTDAYICGGYGKHTPEIKDTIHQMLCKNGIPLNATYTGKAFWGMARFIKENKIENKNILFINTGSVPLFFDDI